MTTRPTRLRTVHLPPRRADEPPPADTALVLLAAGSSSRARTDTNKVLLPLVGRRVVTWTLDWTQRVVDIAVTVVVGRDSELPAIRSVVHRESPHRGVEFVPGGLTRHGSEYAALCHLRSRIEDGTIAVVVIHDSARPLAAPRLFEDVIEGARTYGAALPALVQHSLVREDGRIPEEALVTVQTPQAFRARELLAAYDRADRSGFDGTDTAACFERYGKGRVRAIPGDPRNLKITFPEDLFLAERLLARAHWSL